jgi:hypothetical protein
MAAASASVAVKGVRGGSDFGLTSGAGGGTGKVLWDWCSRDTAVRGSLAPWARVGANGAIDSVRTSAHTSPTAGQIVKRSFVCLISCIIFWHSLEGSAYALDAACLSAKIVWPDSYRLALFHSLKQPATLAVSWIEIIDPAKSVHCADVDDSATTGEKGDTKA